jgi:sugar lactone lactonase YvrE
MEDPALVVYYLQHGISRGTIGVFGPNNTSAYFSNFQYEMDNTLQFDPPPEREMPLGMVTDWEISQPLRYSRIDIEKHYAEQGLDLTWQPVSVEPDGLVNVARAFGRISREPDWVWAKTTVTAEAAEIREFAFGYSDYVSIFLNGQLLYFGNSAYRSRDPSFLGIIGLFDSVFLPLKEGRNELLFLVGESFGGWGFMAQDADAVFLHENLTRLWEIKQTFKFPESAAYDKKRDQLYVTNYFNGGKNEFISTVSLSGEVVEYEWIAGLDRPAGLCLHKDRLYAVDRANLIEIDLKKGEIVSLIPVPEPGFLNDVAVASSAEIYISDSQKNLIYRFKKGKLEVWLESAEITGPNGLLIDGKKLIVGCSGDGTLKSVGLKDKQIGTIVSLGPGSIMDGIKSDGEGNYLCTDFNGRMFKVTAAGEKTLLMDTSARGIPLADFEFIWNQNLLIIPTLNDNRLMAYKLSSE